MRKYIAVAVLCMLSLHLSAQQIKEVPAESERKNLLKMNLLALTMKNFSFQYERAIAPKISAGATIRFMPFGSLPFKSTVKSTIDDETFEAQLEEAEIGNFAFMPEVRFYVGKKGVFRGFYIAPFANIARYKMEVNFVYDDNGVDKNIPMSGKVNTITGGVMFGAQWKLSRQWYLDWWILGPNFGSSKGDISGRISLTPSEQQSLEEELEELDLPLTNFKYTVDGNGADIRVKGPWGGVRSGLCIGFNF